MNRRQIATVRVVVFGCAGDAASPPADMPGPGVTTTPGLFRLY
jgi:hypothetical protein